MGRHIYPPGLIVVSNFSNTEIQQHKVSFPKYQTYTILFIIYFICELNWGLLQGENQMLMKEKWDVIKLCVISKTCKYPPPFSPKRAQLTYSLCSWISYIPIHFGCHILYYIVRISSQKSFCRADQECFPYFSPVTQYLAFLIPERMMMVPE